MSRAPIAVVSYFIAPNPEVGAKRFSFLATEFEKRGRDVQVIAADFDAHGGSDASLPQPSDILTQRNPLPLPLRGGVLARIFNRFTRRWRGAIGNEIFWVRPVVRVACARLRGRPPGVLIATILPPAAAMAASAIAHRMGWRLILDYRDPWTAFPWEIRLRPGLSRRIATWLERRCVARSSARVFNTPEMRASFESYFPTADTARNFVVTNGLVDEIPEAVSARDVPHRNIVYTGAVYGDRSILPVLRALDILRRRNAAFSDVRVEVYGELSGAEEAAIGAAGLAALICVQARVPRAELRARMHGAGLLLAISGRQMLYSVPYKIYDYIPARRPILALTSPESALARFFSDYPVGRAVSPEDVEAVALAIESMLGDRKSWDTSSAVAAHRWDKLADDYLKIVDTVMA